MISGYTFSLAAKKRTDGKSDDNICDQFKVRYPISSERSVNRKVTVSPQLEVGRESSGVALEELCPVSLHHRMEVTVKARMAIRKHT
ncbi:hypothetical protein P5673_008949 [Acropora cervicornis]|uniref:Uncharacterized protein n=1 Tax=Acropora cervicornis TaxID=6130 RepID=A0AAD9QU47_ACRCE|nr:hypothetical protein P5673_008949 [Acropora cervicornis]